MKPRIVWDRYYQMWTPEAGPGVSISVQAYGIAADLNRRNLSFLHAIRGWSPPRRLQPPFREQPLQLKDIP